MNLDTALFPTKLLNFPGGKAETVVIGGRDKFPLMVQAFQRADIRHIAVIGWGSQAPAQAMNLRDSLEGSGIVVEVGLQAGSKSMEKARAAGFTEESGTLGEMFEAIGRSDLVLLLISDAAQVELCDRIFETIRPGAILGLSHGFLLGHLQSVGRDFPDHFSVIGVCPKGMGPSVRRLYEQGQEINGAGINCSYAVHRDLMDSKAVDVALEWAIGIGAPYVFETTLEKEFLSDLTGERGILLGGVWGLVEALYHDLCERGVEKEEAFRLVVESLTGPISENIAKRGGLAGLFRNTPDYEKSTFLDAYVASYEASRPLIEEIYDEVVSGNEIRGVVMAGKRLQAYPMGEIGRTDMWRVGEKVRAKRTAESIWELYPVVAGMYAGMMMAQVDLLLERGHSWSEICNESIIEATDSLTPYMHYKGISHMVDNCSTTARLGARKWAPRFEYAIRQQALPDFNGKWADEKAEEAFKGKWDRLVKAFVNHPVHVALATCSEMRPPVDIAVIA